MGPNDNFARMPVGARAVFDDGRSSIGCHISFSITGARLSLSEATTLPPQFLLEVPIRNKTYRAELRWKSRDAAGVKFLEEVSGQALPATFEDLLEEIAFLRCRNSELEAQLAERGFPITAMTNNPSATAAFIPSS